MASQFSSDPKPNDKKICQRTVIFISILTVILLLLGFFFLFDPMPDKTELLDLCRTALAEFQSTRCYHTYTIHSNGFSQWMILDSPETYHAGEPQDQREYLYITNYEGATTSLLHCGDRYMQQTVRDSDDTDTLTASWYPSVQIYASSFSTYSVADLNLDSLAAATVADSKRESVSLHPATADPVNATVVTLRVEQATGQTQYDFYLDEQNRLFRINDTYLLSNDPAAIRAELEVIRQGAVADSQNYLDHGIQALESLAAKDYYISTYNMTEEIPSLWIRSGENWFSTQLDGDDLTKAIRYNGELLCRDETYYRTHIIGESNWYSVTSAPIEALPWFLTKDWTDAEVTHVSTNESGLNICIQTPDMPAPLSLNFDPEGTVLESLSCDGTLYQIDGDTDPAEALETLYGEITGTIPATLSEIAQKSREAMEFLQTGSYTAVQTKESDNQSVTQFQAFQSGDDLLVQRTGTEDGCLRLDGIHYAHTGEGWTETDAESLGALEGWLLDDLRWDSTRLLVQEYGTESRVTVFDETMPYGFYVAYFHFDSAGLLESLTIYYDAKNAETWSTNTISIVIRHPDPATIDAYLHNVMEE